MTARVQIIVTCEHGGNEIPASYRNDINDAKDLLNSHRGYDLGALELARRIAKKFDAPLEFEKTSRLLIELNRSIGHRQLFSEFSRKFTEEMKQKLIDRYYLPYRTRVSQQIVGLIQTGPVLQLSIHSFTPIMHGKTRSTDLGLLFDPAREFESKVARLWRKQLNEIAPELRTHFNRPYRGTSDGLTVALRREFTDRQYAGLELEVNQKFPLGDVRKWKEIQNQIVTSVSRLRVVLNDA